MTNTIVNIAFMATDKISRMANMIAATPEEPIPLWSSASFEW